MFGVSLCSIGLLLIALFHTGKDIERNFLCNILSNWRYNIQYCVFNICDPLSAYLYSCNQRPPRDGGSGSHSYPAMSLVFGGILLRHTMVS